MKNIYNILFMVKLNYLITWTAFYIFSFKYNFNDYLYKFRFFFLNLDEIFTSKTHFKTVTAYTNNFQKSLIFLIRKSALNFFSKQLINFSLPAVNEYFFYNTHWQLININNNNPLTNVFNKTFYYYFYTSIMVWLDWTVKFKFHLNFLILDYSWLMYSSYNGYFFKIHNF